MRRCTPVLLLCAQLNFSASYDADGLSWYALLWIFTNLDSVLSCVAHDRNARDTLSGAVRMVKEQRLLVEIDSLYEPSFPFSESLEMQAHVQDGPVTVTIEAQSAASPAPPAAGSASMGVLLSQGVVVCGRGY